MTTLPSTDSAIAEKVIGIIADYFSLPPSHVRLELEFFKDLPMDSLDLMEITMKVEEEFCLEVDDDAMSGLRTVGAVVDYVAKQRRPGEA